MISPVRTEQVAARFSAAAPTYDHDARAQRAAAEEVIRMIEGTVVADRIIEIGCGTGILTELICKGFPSAEIEAIDVSAAMIRYADARLGSSANVNLRAADLRNFRSDRQFDLAVSNASLHWILPLDQAFRAVHSILTVGGHLAFSMMLDGTLAELHAARRRIAPHKSSGVDLPTQDDVVAGLAQSGFRVEIQNRDTLVIAYESGSALLQSIHNQGVTGTTSVGTSLNRGELRLLVGDYDAHYRTDGGVSATYEILYVLAQREDDV